MEEVIVGSECSALDYLFLILRLISIYYYIVDMSFFRCFISSMYAAVREPNSWELTSERFGWPPKTVKSTLKKVNFSDISCFMFSTYIVL